MHHGKYIKKIMTDAGISATLTLYICPELFTDTPSHIYFGVRTLDEVNDVPVSEMKDLGQPTARQALVYLAHTVPHDGPSSQWVADHLSVMFNPWCSLYADLHEKTGLFWSFDGKGWRVSPDPLVQHDHHEALLLAAKQMLKQMGIDL